MPNSLSDYFSLILTTNLLPLSLLKYGFAQNYPYPFLALLVSTLPMAIIGFFLQLNKLLDYTGRDKMFYLKGWSYFLIGIFYTAAFICFTGSLFYQHMTLFRFLIYSYATEVIFMPCFSYFILKREVFSQYLGAVIVVIGAVLIHELAFLEKDSNANEGVKSYIVDGYQGPLLAISGKIFHLFSTVYSKKLIIIRAFFYKLKDAESFKQPSFNNMNPKDQRRVSQFYQEYFEGEQAPKLLKKDSILVKRFELFKKIEMMLYQIDNQKNVNDPQFKQIKSDKLQLIKKIANLNNVKPREISKIPKYNDQKPLLQFKMDFGFLQAEELDEIMDMDETQINSMIKKQTALKFSELKKWELEALLIQEEEEKKYLESFLQDYKDVKINAHIFHNLDDLLLTKLDSVYDNMIYDSELFSFDQNSNMELYGTFTLLAAFFNNEIYNQIYIKNDDRTAASVSMFDSYHNVLFIIAAVFMIIKPLVISQVITYHDKGSYMALKLLTDYLILMVASTFTEQNPYLRTNQLIALGLTCFGQYLIYIGTEHNRRWAEFASLISMAKTYFSELLEPEQITMLEIRLIQIHYVLGREEFLRVLIDLLVSKNPRTLLYTANPVMFLRKQFDPFYLQRIKNWAGSFPRPLVESLESTWISTDHKDIWIQSLNMFKKPGDFKDFQKKSFKEQINEQISENSMSEKGNMSETNHKDKKNNLENDPSEEDEIEGMKITKQLKYD